MRQFPEILVNDEDGSCRHLRGVVYGYCRIGGAYCPDCRKEVGLDEVFTNMLKAMRETIGIPEHGS